MTQKEVDTVVLRIRRLIERYGRNSPRLKSVRDLYALFHARAEPGSFGLLQAALAEAEERP